ncbi:MAG: P-loop NTPase [Deltaproteobacteria bacterium]|nr:P-loop NTPase [Deltaproteobacteria bacterium]
MKIIICGKGGSGKSTITALLAQALQERKFNVVLIDADESNLGLHRLMGVSAPVNIMDNLGGKKEFKKKMNSPLSGGIGELFRDNMKIDEIPADCITQRSGISGGIKLLSIGKIHTSGEGCACPMGVLSKMILSKLALGDHDIILIDTGAGVEHFGRGIDLKCDLILSIVDPSFESFMLAKKMANMADQAEIDLFFILNKVDDNVIEAMTAGIDQERVITKIPQNKSIFLKSLEGRELTEHIPEIDPVCSLIEKRRVEAHS